MTTAPLRKTPLHRRHVELGARMVEFGGWHMPVYYTGITEEHRAVRARSGVFDVSHMGQIEVSGRGAHAFLQSVLSNDLDKIGAGRAQYTLLTNAKGGIVDDLIAYKRGAEDYLLVVNAANTDTDREHLESLVPDGVQLTDRSEEYGMLALQGPDAPEVLRGAWDKGNPKLDAIPPFGFVEAAIDGVPCIVARTGYTGEIGYELMCPADRAEDVFDTLLKRREFGVVPCGLGARDTLRLEVCYPLHGNDISAETNALEAGLGWVCALDKEFTGVEALRKTRERGPRRRLVAFRMVERAIPRAGLKLSVDGREVGAVSSGTLSPSLDQGIGMGYVEAGLAAPGTLLTIDVRGRLREAEIATKPLYTKES